MTKKVINLTHDEQEVICDAQRRRNKTDRPRTACDTCPLCWVNHCTLCEGIMAHNLIARMYNTIGDNQVNLEHYQENMEATK